MTLWTYLTVVGAHLATFAAGAWWQHKRHVRRILSEGFWPLAPGYGDRRARKEVDAQSLAQRTVATSGVGTGRPRVSTARFRGRRMQ